MKPQITFEQSLSGWLTLSAIHKGERVQQKYCGYSLREAKKKFNEYLSKHNEKK